LGSLKGRDDSEDLGVVGRRILKRILGNRGMWTEFTRLRIGPVKGSYKHMTNPCISQTVNKINNFNLKHFLDV
jgi:hypothetical protein